MRGQFREGISMVSEQSGRTITFNRPITMERLEKLIQRVVNPTAGGLAEPRLWKHWTFRGDNSAEASHGGPAYIDSFQLNSCQVMATVHVTPLNDDRWWSRQRFTQAVIRLPHRPAAGIPECCCHRDSELSFDEVAAQLEQKLLELDGTVPDGVELS